MVFAKTPKKDYYACIFSSIRTPENNEEYNKMADEMDELAKSQDGYLGIESTRNDHSRFGITVSYWESLNSIKNWKDNSNHKIAQKFGITNWYEHYEIRICQVKYSYSKETQK
ncbi:hypothetical protein ACTFIY_002157 [Dictyostelium cf. discoideum]